MKCPNYEKDLVSAEKDGLILDLCPTCKGIWFNAWEWEDLAEAINIDKDKLNMYINQICS